MLLKRIVFIPIFTLLSSCTWFYSQFEFGPPEELATSMQLLSEDQFQISDTEEALSIEHFLSLPADIRLHLDQSILPLDSDEKRHQALPSISLSMRFNAKCR